MHSESSKVLNTIGNVRWPSQVFPMVISRYFMESALVSGYELMREGSAG